MQARWIAPVSCGLLAFASVARAQSSTVKLSDTPMLVIGAEGDGTAYQLDRVYGATRFPDGTIVVGNSATSELRFFSASGKHLRSAARTGAGPGEIAAGVSVVPMQWGSSLLVGDVINARVNRYDLNGRTLPQLHFISSPPAVQSVLTAVAGQTLVARVTANARLEGNPGQRIATQYRYGLYDTTGKQRVLLFELPTAERIVHSFGGRTRFPYIPFSPEPLLAAAADKIYLIRNGAPTVEVWNTAGKQVRSLRWAAEQPRVREIWSRWRQSELDAMTRQADKLFYGDYFSDKLPLPEYVPVAEALHADPLGRVWVIRTKLPWETQRRADVLDAGGRFVGTVTLPPRFTVLEVGRDYLLGRVLDEDDVERVELYRVTWR